jgi:hypothetical protein
MSFPSSSLDSVPHIVHGELKPHIALQVRNSADIRPLERALKVVLPALDAARIVIG